MKTAMVMVMTLAAATAGFALGAFLTLALAGWCLGGEAEESP